MRPRGPSLSTYCSRIQRTLFLIFGTSPTISCSYIPASALAMPWYLIAIAFAATASQRESELGFAIHDEPPVVDKPLAVILREVCATGLRALDGP